MPDVQKEVKKMDPLPKLCGTDIELGNFMLGIDKWGGTCDIASRILLREIQGVSPSVSAQSDEAECGCPHCRSSEEQGKNGSVHPSQDWGRKYLKSNGGCAYIDLNHLELCTPEVVSAFDHVASWNAMLRIAQEALLSANAKLGRNVRIQALVNNSDGLGHSYGSHLNFLITRETWENIFNRKLHYMLYLAAYQVSSIIFTGLGKAGSENGMPHVDFQISQRADFFEQLTGVQTTFNRPLVNGRDQALCGSGKKRNSGDSVAERMARLHIIFFDNTTLMAANLLRVGVTQIILSMLEHGRINPNLLLDDPLEAVVSWSHDPSLRAKAKTASGQRLTAVELQFLFLNEAKRFQESTDCSRWVPRAGEILALWEDTLDKLRTRDFPALARRLDWVLKMTILNRVMESQPRLNWRSPQIKHLDHIYSSLDPHEGLFWAYAQNGFMERFVDESRIDWFVHNPPEDTRAWTRAMILRRVLPESLESMDWDSIRIKTRRKGSWSRYAELDMSDPTGFTREAVGHVFREESALEDILECLSTNPADDTADEQKETGEAGNCSLPARQIM
jgi:Pup amidohydrolase